MASKTKNVSWNNEQHFLVPILRLDGYDIGTCQFCGSLVPLIDCVIATHKEWHKKHFDESFPEIKISEY